MNPAFAHRYTSTYAACPTETPQGRRRIHRQDTLHMRTKGLGAKPIPAIDPVSAHDVLRAVRGTNERSSMHGRLSAMLRILSSASARPNFVKLAAVHHALVARGNVEHIILHTGQHYDPLFSDIFFRELQLPDPSMNLGIRGGEREDVISRTRVEAAKALEQLHPDIVLVYGDVNGAAGVAQAANACGIRLGHIEAGLRSGDLSMPEEMNRIGIDRIAHDLFVTEESGIDHLRKEKVQGNVHMVGNTMIDTLVRMRPKIEQVVPIEHLPGAFGVVTLHRPSNVDDPERLRENFLFLAELSRHLPLILPLHRRTQSMVTAYHLDKLLPKQVRVIEPLGYTQCLSLLLRSSFILTDSGGIQEEAAFLGKRCFTLRLNTERPSTITSGSNKLIDLQREGDRESVIAFAEDPVAPTVVIPPLWDGHAGTRIVDVLMQTPLTVQDPFAPSSLP